MTISASRIICDSAKPIFFDLEVNTVGENTNVPKCITQLGAYDPERNQTFMAHVKVAPEAETQQKDHSFTSGKPIIEKFEFKEVWKKFVAWVREDQNYRDKKGKLHERKVVYIAHNNYKHDNVELKRNLSRIQEAIPSDWKPFCTLYLAGTLYGRYADNSLQALRHQFNISSNEAHNADKDALTLYRVFEKIVGDADRNKIYASMLLPKEDHPVISVAKLIKVHEVAIPIFFDTETTGLDTENDKIVEISCYAPTLSGEKAWFSKLVNPEIDIPLEATNIHHISSAMVKDEETFDIIASKMFRWVKTVEAGTQNARVCFVAHNNFGFDWKILKAEFERIGRKLPVNWKPIDTFRISRSIRKGYNKEFSHKLQSLREVYGIPETKNAHRAFDDVEVLYKVFMKMIGKADINDVLHAMLEHSSSTAIAEVVRKANPMMELGVFEIDADDKEIEEDAMDIDNEEEVKEVTSETLMEVDAAPKKIKRIPNRGIDESNILPEGTRRHRNTNIRE
ncbi:MAG: exonuclease domain-containing protein [Chlamydiota bacterium]|nr:exonuclease domain-containing protein [Chlamydiota bacterium]